MTVSQRLVEFDWRARSFRTNRPSGYAALPTRHGARLGWQLDFFYRIIADIRQSNAHATILVANRVGAGLRVGRIPAWIRRGGCDIKALERSSRGGRPSTK